MASDDNPFGDSSSDEDDDFFCYQKQEFHKKEEENFVPSPPKRRRATKQVSTDDALSKLERRRERQSSKPPYSIAAQQDDESDVEAERAVQAAETSQAAAKSDKNLVDLLDSSDEDAPSAAAAAATFTAHRQAPVAVMARTGIDMETCIKIAQARHAMHKLEQAQLYHGEDVWVPVPQPQPVVLNLESPAVAHPEQPKLPTDLGPTLQLKLRTTHVVNGKRSESPTTEIMSIRRMEPFQKLMERYQSLHNIVPSQSSVKFSVDGENIDLNKNPAFYDFEDDDLVEVLVTSLVVVRTSTSSSATATSATANLGPALQLKLRMQEKNGTTTMDVMTIRENEPLENLMDKYKKKKKLGSAHIILTFDGDTINLTKTPASYEMESEDIIDVVHK